MIEFQKKKHSDQEIFTALNPLLGGWFKWKFGSFTEPQKYSILNICKRQNTLVSAETGTGKTLSAFSAILSELITLSEKGQLEDRIYCVYVSPLRALNNDIERNLLEPLKAVEKAAKKLKKKIKVRVAVRTGDTTPSQRAAMSRKPPHLLITTPESLAIILNSPKFKENLRQIQWVIVDEIHALAPNKRGVHLSLSLERLQELSPGLTRIGLSATISPLEEVAKFLVGFENGKPRDCKIVDVSFLKKMDLKVLCPLPNLINVTQKQIHDALYHQFHGLIQKHKTTLIFTNTRAATERVVHNLKELFPKDYGANIEAHHSSLSREHRLRVENRLKKGELKCIVSSTSLELGIDIGFIDLVLLLGSPKSVARAIQRVGRSGHKLHDTIKGRIIVLDRDDLVECSVLLKSALEKKIDSIQIPKNCLDVLSQQVYGIAIDKIREEKEIFKLIKQSYCFQGLGRTDYFEVLDYLSGEYASLEARHVYAKIWFDRETGMIGKRGKMARVIYMTNIGTIPDEAKVKVKVGDYTVGTLDELFLERLRKSDVFVLGGQSYAFKFSRGMTVQVSSAEKRPPTVPSWMSEMLPLSFELALDIGRFRRLLGEKFKAKKTKKEILAFILDYLYVDANAAHAIYEFFREQFLYSEIPDDKTLLIEHYKEGSVNHFIFHSLFGRRTNDALSRCYAFVISKLSHKDVEIVLNDNGFILSCRSDLPLDKTLKAVNAKDFRAMLEMSLRKSEILKRRFRHCATRALMILRSYRGKTKTVGRQQMNARLLLSAVERISPDFVILKETRREIMEDAFDIQNALRVIDKMGKGKIKVKKLVASLPSPFAFNLFAQGFADILKAEGRLAFIQRMHEKVMESIQAKY